jgi:hypothetical protein
MRKPLTVRTLMAYIAVVALMCGLRPSDCTKYAPGYSEAKFNRIKLGMNVKEVLNTAGEPLIAIDRTNTAIYPDGLMLLWAEMRVGREFWPSRYQSLLYTQPPDEPYPRYVCFDNAGHVGRIGKINRICGFCILRTLVNRGPILLALTVLLFLARRLTHPAGADARPA